MNKCMKCESESTATYLKGYLVKWGYEKMPQEKKDRCVHLCTPCSQNPKFKRIKYMISVGKGHGQIGK